MIKIKHVTCGQDSRLPSWETSLTHCVCPGAKTLRGALASFLPAEQGALCLTSLASAWGCGEVNYCLRRYVSWWNKRPNRREEGYSQPCNPLNPAILTGTQEPSTWPSSCRCSLMQTWPNHYKNITVKISMGVRLPAGTPAQAHLWGAATHRASDMFSLVSYSVCLVFPRTGALSSALI